MVAECISGELAHEKSKGSNNWFGFAIPAEALRCLLSLLGAHLRYVKPEEGKSNACYQNILSTHVWCLLGTLRPHLRYVIPEGGKSNTCYQNILSTHNPMLLQCSCHPSPTIENLSKVYRKSIEHVSKIYRTSIENLSKIYRQILQSSSNPPLTLLRSSSNPPPIFLQPLLRAFTDHLLNIHGQSIEHLTSTEHLSNIQSTSI